MTATPRLQGPGQNGNEIAKFELSPAVIAARSSKEKIVACKALPYRVRAEAADEGGSDDHRGDYQWNAHCGAPPQAVSDAIPWIEETLIHVRHRERGHPGPGSWLKASTKDDRIRSFTPIAVTAARPQEPCSAPV